MCQYLSGGWQNRPFLLSHYSWGHPWNELGCFNSQLIVPCVAKFCHIEGKNNWKRIFCHKFHFAGKKVRKKKSQKIPKFVTCLHQERELQTFFTFIFWVLPNLAKCSYRGCFITLESWLLTLVLYRVPMNISTYSFAWDSYPGRSCYKVGAQWKKPQTN
jgi:hypothetical protein